MKILIADDEALYRELLSGIIAQWPEHQVTVVEDGLDTWKMLDDPRRYFDVVFLDIKMPGLTGLEVLKKVRSSPMLENTAIVMCTAYNDRETILKVGELGTKHFIVKPYTDATIAEKLKRIDSMISQSPEFDRRKRRV